VKINHFSIMFITVILALALANPALADSFTGTIDVYKKDESVQPFFKSAYGYAVFPNVGKGGIVIGGAYGKGQVYRGGKVTGETSLFKATIGFQLGGQVFSEIIFFEDKRTYEKFISGEFEFDAVASAVAITAGVQVKAGTEGVTASASAVPTAGEHADTSYYKGMAVFVHTIGGLMYEATIGGQKFTFKAK
jgi:lipid-binding SYLF domain-containing protein